MKQLLKRWFEWWSGRRKPDYRVRVYHDDQKVYDSHDPTDPVEIPPFP